MTIITLPNTGLFSGYTDAQSGWGVTMNHNMRVLDALVQAHVLSRLTSAPPGSPASGDVYIVGPSGSGAWNGHDNDLAIWVAGDDITSAWTFVTPRLGWSVFVEDEYYRYEWLGSEWTFQFAQVTPLDIGSVSTATYDIHDYDAGVYTRYTYVGAKTVTFRPNSVHALPNRGEFTIANRAASGDLTLAFTSPAVGNAPAGGSLVLTPGMIAMVKRISTDLFDVTV